MRRELQKIGIHDTVSGRECLSNHFDDVLNDPSNILNIETRSYAMRELPGEPTVEYTATTRESLLMGSGGAVKLRSGWDENKLLTVIIKAGKKGGKKVEKKEENRLVQFDIQFNEVESLEELERQIDTQSIIVCGDVQDTFMSIEYDNVHKIGIAYYDYGLKPEYMYSKDYDYLYLGFGMKVICIDLNENAVIENENLSSVFYEFISDSQKDYICAICEIEVYCFHENKLLWDTGLTDIVCGYEIVDDSKILVKCDDGLTHRFYLEDGCLDMSVAELERLKKVREMNMQNKANIIIDDYIPLQVRFSSNLEVVYYISYYSKDCTSLLEFTVAEKSRLIKRITLVGCAEYSETTNKLVVENFEDGIVPLPSPIDPDECWNLDFPCSVFKTILYSNAARIILSDKNSSKYIKMDRVYFGLSDADDIIEICIDMSVAELEQLKKFSSRE